MAERNPQIPHSIQHLLCVDRNGNYCGYKPELISDSISGDLREFLICSECKGICRRATQGRGKTVCKMCTTEKGRDIDERIENKVASLNSKCPLSRNGCGWTGLLGAIETHMHGCSELLIECQLKCGTILRRENNTKHNKEACPMRMVKCQYCEREIQVQRQNQHVGECTDSPDTKVPCPYKELGCNATSPRGKMDRHQTEDIMHHQKLMLDQLNQLKDRKQSNKARKKGMLWVMLVMGIVAAVAVGQLIETNRLSSDLLVANNRLLQLQQKQEFVENSLQEHYSEFNKAQQLIADKDLEINHFRQVMEQLNKTVSMLVPTGRLDWKIRGVKQKIGRTEHTYSDPFYVGLYKIQGNIVWSYNNSGQVGCFIHIMKGEFDDNLKWPFIFRYKFVLLNQNGNEDDYILTHEITKEDLHKFPECFERPTEMLNTGFGHLLSITHTELLTDTYCREDSISLHITMEQIPL